MNKYTILVFNDFRKKVHLEFVEAICVAQAIILTKKFACEAIGGVEHNWEPLYTFKGHCETVTEESEMSDDNV